MSEERILQVRSPAVKSSLNYAPNNHTFHSNFFNVYFLRYHWLKALLGVPEGIRILRYAPCHSLTMCSFDSMKRLGTVLGTCVVRMVAKDGLRGRHSVFPYPTECYLFLMTTGTCILGWRT